LASKALSPFPAQRYQKEFWRENEGTSAFAATPQQRDINKDILSQTTAELAIGVRDKGKIGKVCHDSTTKKMTVRNGR
jgi:hypothetical protein